MENDNGREVNRKKYQIKFKKSLLDERPSNTLTLVIKNYKSKDGLSRRITQNEKVYDCFSGPIGPATYNFRCPLGKGLDI
jgi:hypothetical protein